MRQGVPQREHPQGAPHLRGLQRGQQPRGSQVVLRRGEVPQLLERGGLRVQHLLQDLLLHQGEGDQPRHREVVHQERPPAQQALGLDRRTPGLREAVRRIQVLGHPLQAQLMCHFS